MEPKYTGGSTVAINVIKVENEIIHHMYERSELDYLICNDLLAYTALILNSNPEVYLKMVTEYKPCEN